MKKRYRLTLLSKILITAIILIILAIVTAPKNDSDLDECIRNNPGHKQTPEAAEAWCIRNLKKVGE